MKKSKKYAPGQITDEQLHEALAQRAKQVETFGEEAVAIYEKTNGQQPAPTLDPVDVLGRIARDGDRGAPYDRLQDWKPKMAVAPEMLLPFAESVAEARREVEQEQFNSLSTAGKQLYMLEKEQAKAIAQQKAAEDHASWLAEPKVASIVKRLKALDEATAKDQEWDFAETALIAKALASFETVGADRDAAHELAQESLNTAAKKKLAKMNAAELERERLRTEIALLTEGVEPPKPEANTAPDAKPEAKPEAKAIDSALLAELSAAETAYFDIKSYCALDFAGKEAAGSRYDAALAAVEAAQATT